jgi:hypothetical protein
MVLRTVVDNLDLSFGLKVVWGGEILGEWGG